MEITHVKFDEIGSTQDWLRENISNHKTNPILVSTKAQTKGLGRHGNSWNHFKNSLAFSFSVRPMPTLTLTPLEIGLLIAEFLESLGQDIVLKWPNDLLIADTEGLKKVGGILCHHHTNEMMIVGVGLNLSLDKEFRTDNFKFSPGSISLKNSIVDQHLLPENIYKWILEKRKVEKSLLKNWTSRCAHLNKRVRIGEENSFQEGLFKGIGENGEALIELENGKIQKCISGSLWILD